MTMIFLYNMFWSTFLTTQPCKANILCRICLVHLDQKGPVNSVTSEKTTTDYILYLAFKLLRL